MKTHNLPIKFALSEIKTIEFATIKEAYTEENPFEYSINAQFEVISIKENIIASIVEFAFKQTKIPFLKVKVACAFSIEKNSWNAAYDSEQNRVVFPKNFADHLVAITIGTVRGVLHAKTEGTIFNRFFMPTINVAEISNNDLIIEIGES